MYLLRRTPEDVAFPERTTVSGQLIVDRRGRESLRYLEERTNRPDIVLSQEPQGNKVGTRGLRRKG